MINALQKKINKTLATAIDNASGEYYLVRHSPLLYKAIKSFLTKGGKRIRPLLLIISYHGYAKKPSNTIFHGATGFELLHNCSIIHDDIIDDTPMRRHLPSMHQYLAVKLKSHAGRHCSGVNLALVVGDILYSLGIKELLKMKMPPDRINTALRFLLDAATYTGIGEFKELVATTKPISSFTKKEIYSIYNLKTVII